MRLEKSFPFSTLIQLPACMEKWTFFENMEGELILLSHRFYVIRTVETREDLQQYTLRGRRSEAALYRKVGSCDRVRWYILYT